MQEQYWLHLILIPYSIYALYDIWKNNLSFWRLLRLIYLIFYLGNVVNFFFIPPPYFLDKISDNAIKTGNLLFFANLFIMELSAITLRRFIKEHKNNSPILKPINTNRYITFSLIAFAFYESILLLNGLNILSIKPYQITKSNTLYFIISTLIPFGLAARERLKFKGYFWDITLLFLLSFFSPSRAQFVFHLFNFFLALSFFNSLKSSLSIFTKYIVLLILFGIISLGIKQQIRVTNHITSISTKNLLSNTGNALSMRFMGGIYRTYLKTVETVIEKKYTTLNGKYHEFILYCYIPRFLWKDKPTPAKDYAYRYLDFGKSNTTSWSLTHFGTLLIDFGLIGLFIGSSMLSIFIVLFEYLLSYLEQHMAHLHKSFFILLNYAFLTFTFSVAESGIISFFSGISLLLISTMIYNIYHLQERKWLKY